MFCIIITDFHDQIYKYKDAVTQNKYITQFLIPHTPERRRPRKEEPRERVPIQYCVKKRGGNLLRVCAATFRSITCLG